MISSDVVLKDELFQLILPILSKKLGLIRKIKGAIIKPNIKKPIIDIKMIKTIKSPIVFTTDLILERFDFDCFFVKE